MLHLIYQRSMPLMSSTVSNLPEVSASDIKCCVWYTEGGCLWHQVLHLINWRSKPLMSSAVFNIPEKTTWLNSERLMSSRGRVGKKYIHFSSWEVKSKLWGLIGWFNTKGVENILIECWEHFDRESAKNTWPRTYVQNDFHFRTQVVLDQLISYTKYY